MPNESQKPASKLLFLEKATWKKGQEIITVLLTDEHGKKHRVGHIYLDYKQEEGEKPRAVFISNDSKGQEIFPPADNLFKLKKEFIGLEPELAQVVKQQQLENTRGKNKDAGKDKGMVRE